ncbi:MAG: LemA family protein [Chitinophagaceae bacterium]|nr:LemA family protein [Chitinophagaceae bacterium]
MSPLIIIIILFVILIPVFIYNNLIRKKNAVDNAFFSIDVMLKKRYDLIPQLVETVKGYMQHERGLLTSVTELRQKVMQDNLSANERVKLDNQINTVLQQIFVSFENYPQLKASENFLRLQGAINEAEEQLAASRRFYNAAVNDYHNAIETFPSSVIASLAGMGKKEYFSIPDSQKLAPSANVK